MSMNYSNELLCIMHEYELLNLSNSSRLCVFSVDDENSSTCRLRDSKSKSEIRLRSLKAKNSIEMYGNDVISFELKFH